MKIEMYSVWKNKPATIQVWFDDGTDAEMTDEQLVGVIGSDLFELVMEEPYKDDVLYTYRRIGANANQV